MLRYYQTYKMWFFYLIHMDWAYTYQLGMLFGFDISCVVAPFVLPRF
jgi:hypothetical protein